MWCPERTQRVSRSSDELPKPTKRIRADGVSIFGCWYNIPSDLSEDVAKLLRCGFISQMKGMIKPHLITQGEVLKTHQGELAVRNGHHGSLERSDEGRAQADIFDGTGMVSCPGRSRPRGWVDPR